MQQLKDRLFQDTKRTSAGPQHCESDARRKIAIAYAMVLAMAWTPRAHSNERQHNAAGRANECFV
jgi:hypothetical protein